MQCDKEVIFHDRCWINLSIYLFLIKINVLQDFTMHENFMSSLKRIHNTFNNTNKISL